MKVAGCIFAGYHHFPRQTGIPVGETVHRAARFPKKGGMLGRWSKNWRVSPVVVMVVGQDSADYPQKRPKMKVAGKNSAGYHHFSRQQGSPLGDVPRSGNRAGAAADHCGDRQLRHATGLGSGKGPARGGRHRMCDGYGGQSIVSENHCPLLPGVPPSQCVGETVQKLARLPGCGDGRRGGSGYDGADQASTGKPVMRG